MKERLPYRQTAELSSTPIGLSDGIAPSFNDVQIYSGLEAALRSSWPGHHVHGNPISILSLTVNNVLCTLGR